MSIMERISNYVPNKSSVQFLWTVGGWFAIALILANTLLMFWSVLIQMSMLSATSLGIGPGTVRQALDGDAGLAASERRQLLVAAKTFVIIRGALADFSLVFIKRIGNWVLLEAVPAEEGLDPTRVLMERRIDMNNEWTGRALGPDFSNWADTVPAELLR